MFTKLSSRPAPSSGSFTLTSELERDMKQQRKESNSRRVLATAQAIADDDNHPYQEEVSGARDVYILIVIFLSVVFSAFYTFSTRSLRCTTRQLN